MRFGHRTKRTPFAIEFPSFRAVSLLKRKEAVRSFHCRPGPARSHEYESSALANGARRHTILHLGAALLQCCPLVLTLHSECSNIGAAVVNFDRTTSDDDPRLGVDTNRSPAIGALAPFFCSGFAIDTAKAIIVAKHKPVSNAQAAADGPVILH